MKRLIPAVILFILVITICISTNIIVKDVCEKAQELVNECEAFCYTGDFENAAKVSKQLSHQWEKESKFVIIFVNHKLCDEVSFFANRLYYHSLIKNLDFMISDISDIKTKLHQIVSEQKLTPLSFY